MSYLYFSFPSADYSQRHIHFFSLADLDFEFSAIFNTYTVKSIIPKVWWHAATLFFIYFILINKQHYCLVRQHSTDKRVNWRQREAASYKAIPK
jgi:hypothetical protein